MFPRSYTVQSWVKNKILSYSAWSSAFLLCCSVAIFSCYVIHTNLIFVFFFSTGALNQLILLITRTGSRSPKMALQSEKLPAMRDVLLEARPKCWNSTSALLSVSLKFPWLSFFSWASLNGPASLLTVAFALPFGARLLGAPIYFFLSHSKACPRVDTCILALTCCLPPGCLTSWLWAQVLLSSWFHTQLLRTEIPEKQYDDDPGDSWDKEQL